jgi:cell division GTPase FtsZ
MGVGEASGKEKVVDASRSAVESSLMETSIKGAKRILIKVTGSPDLAMDDVEQVVGNVQEAASPEANIIFGVDFDANMVDALRVTVIATDFETESLGSRSVRTFEEKLGKPASASDFDYDTVIASRPPKPISNTQLDEWANAPPEPVSPDNASVADTFDDAPKTKDPWDLILDSFK